MPFTLSVEPDFVRVALVGTVTRVDPLDLALNDHPQVEIRIFDGAAEAEAWLMEAAS